MIMGMNGTLCRKKSGVSPLHEGWNLNGDPRGPQPRIEAMFYSHDCAIDMDNQLRKTARLAPYDQVPSFS
jgi:hypothetical protein